MKKIRFIFLAIAMVLSLNLYAQSVSDYPNWWFPSAFGDCRDTIIYPMGRSLREVEAMEFPLYSIANKAIGGDTITDLEQRYDVDSTVRIAGVAMSGLLLTNQSFRIIDVESRERVIFSAYQPELTTVYQDASGRVLKEYIFDSVLTIDNDFILSYWFPEEMEYFLYSLGCVNVYFFVTNENWSEFTACNSGKTATFRYSDGSRRPFLQEYGDVESAFVGGYTYGGFLEHLGINETYFCDVGIFPIFAEEEENDNSNGGDSDSNSFLPSVEVEKYTSVFPNPASRSLNVVCSYKIKSYSILNALGQEIRSENSNANTLNINLDGLESGAYFIKITTDKGSATKRFIVQ